MRLITDFDGVWTDPAREARAIEDVVAELLAQRAELPIERVRSLLADVRAHVRLYPERYGWRCDGALSAYADEDPFCFHSGVYLALAEAREPKLAPLARALEDFGGPGRFGGHCYELGVARSAEQHGFPIRADARALLDALLVCFDEVVVVSNSSEQKLLDNFGHAGVQAGAGAHERLRLRGRARKFALEAEPPPPGGRAVRTFAGREVRIDRGCYHALLREEEPDAVVGDVFSLDLALPLVLREADPRFAELQVLLLQREYTPEWTLRAVSGRTGVRVVSSLDELVESPR